MSHGPAAPRRDSCALTQRRRLPRIPPLTPNPPFFPPPPQNPPGSPRKSGGAAWRWGGAGRIWNGWELRRPEMLPPHCAEGRGGHGVSPWGLSGPLCALCSPRIPLGYAEVGLRDGVTLGPAWELR